ncbi:hypothetical protein [Nocardia flavorosea]|uniref:Uncharacterized protein n=1 Tax=Nocardia flavorosea TaxID=53429 RepID=A0A846Y5X2_9NOCA|nr:hypothetical protein [Nocardia flavorosea]
MANPDNRRAPFRLPSARGAHILGDRIDQHPFAHRDIGDIDGKLAPLSTPNTPAPWV